MKNILLIVALFSASIIACKAQDTSFNKSVVHGKKQSYNVTESILHHKYITNTNKHVYEKHTNKSSDVVAYPRNSDVKYDKNVIRQIITSVFTKLRLKKLAEENLVLQINYSVDLQGTILEVSFVTPDTSSITPIEIENLESLILKNFKFTINAKAFEGHDYVLSHNFIDFKRLVENAPNAISP